MNKELKQNWIDALTSGKYTQGKELLCNGKSHCCLGVLANIVDPSKWTIGVTNFDYDFGDCNGYAFPTDKWLINIGLSNEIASHLARMNDKGCSFKEIAEYIRKIVPETD